MEKNEETKQAVTTTGPTGRTFTDGGTFTDIELLTKRFPDLAWVVPDLIPEGLMVFAGKPKVGKSTFMLGITSCVARGGKALGEIEVEPKEVIFFALEDTERRLKAHLTKIQGDAGTGRIHFATSGPKKAESVTSFLERHIGRHPAVRLIVIDTLGRFCGYKGTSSYQQSYGLMSEIKSVADKHCLAIIVIHHARKLKGDDDLDTVMGSTGITGTADTVAVLKRDRGQNHGSLLIAGREVEEIELALQFEPETLSWKLLGPANENRMSQERQEVLEMLRRENRDVKLKQISEALGKKRPVLSKLLNGLIEDGLVEQPKYGFYQAISTSNGEISNCGETGETVVQGETRLEGETVVKGETAVESETLLEGETEETSESVIIEKSVDTAMDLRDFFVAELADSNPDEEFAYSNDSSDDHLYWDLEHLPTFDAAADF